jgi:hypothetical protein
LQTNIFSLLDIDNFSVFSGTVEYTLFGSKAPLLKLQTLRNAVQNFHFCILRHSIVKNEAEVKLSRKYKVVSLTVLLSGVVGNFQY